MSPYINKYSSLSSQRAQQDGAEREGLQAHSPIQQSPSTSALTGSRSPSPQHTATQDLIRTPPDTLPVTEEILLQHLNSLQDSLTHTIADTVAQALTAVKADIVQLGDRTDKMENTMDEMINSYNALADEHNALQSDYAQLKLLCEDLENRNRRNNLRIRGIPDAVKQIDLKAYLHEFFATLIPDHPSELWRMDRAHRALGARPPDAKLPKDVILCLHFFESKDLIIQTTRNRQSIVYRGVTLQVFNDVSAITLAKRRTLKPLTQQLREHNIPYRWGYPFKLIAVKGGRTYVLQDVSQMKQFSLALELPFEGMTAQPPRRMPPSRMQPLWNKASTAPRQGLPSEEPGQPHPQSVRDGAATTSRDPQT